jgi:hypothetical protein
VFLDLQVIFHQLEHYYQHPHQFFLEIYVQMNTNLFRLK